MDNYPNPLIRFWSLLKADNKEIRQIYSLSFFSGLVALTLPLGIQAIINIIINH
jgi:ABC-type bacteriocin/lantibiotic exporter with double-glycine peptidase domain